MNFTSAIVILPLVIWFYLLVGRAGFWRAQPRLDHDSDTLPGAAGDVIAVIPARDEAEAIAAAVRSLLAQDYVGRLRIIVVDDHSGDGTAKIVEDLIPLARTDRRVEVVANLPLPAGWSGKLWAIATGLSQIQSAPYLLLTDADIQHDPGNLRRLVAAAERDRLDLVSLMVRLRCKSFWERLLVPPFVFFFQMIYPFTAVSDPARRIAAAAGGCMLVRWTALQRSGGIEGIRGALIDDVALARQIKRHGGRIWLGLTARTVSLRAYDDLAGIWRMVARTADTQLRHSLVLLAVAVLGLGLAFLLPVAVVAAWPWHGDGLALTFGLAAWLAMTVAFWPTARLYNAVLPWVVTLPVAAAFYLAMTVDSAIRYRRGQGGFWKGRILAD